MYPEEPRYRFNEARTQKISQKLVSEVHNGILSMSKKAGSQKITEQRLEIKFFSKKGNQHPKSVSITPRGIRKQ